MARVPRLVLGADDPTLPPAHASPVVEALPVAPETSDRVRFWSPALVSAAQGDALCLSIAKYRTQCDSQVHKALTADSIAAAIHLHGATVDFKGLTISPDLCPEVHALQVSYERIAGWVVAEIVGSPSDMDLISEQLMLEQMVRIMYHLNSMHNFHALFAVSAGLQRAEISSQVWSRLSKESEALWATILAIIDPANGHEGYLARLKEVQAQKAYYIPNTVLQLTAALNAIDANPDHDPVEELTASLLCSLEWKPNEEAKGEGEVEGDEGGVAAYLQSASTLRCRPKGSHTAFVLGGDVIDSPSGKRKKRHSVFAKRRGRAGSTSGGSTPVGPNSVPQRSVSGGTVGRRSSGCNLTKSIGLSAQLLLKVTSTSVGVKIMEFLDRVGDKDLPQPRVMLNYGVVHYVCSWLQRHDCLAMEGLYRVSASSVTVDTVWASFCVDKPGFLEDDQQSPHIIANAFKTYLRKLAEPVVPFSKYDSFLQAYRENAGKGVDALVKAMSSICEDMSRVNAASLRLLCEHIAAVGAHEEVNKMSVQNLALMFAPNVLRSDDESPERVMKDNKDRCDVMAFLIRENVKVFANIPLLKESEEKRLVSLPFAAAAPQLTPVTSPPVATPKSKRRGLFARKKRKEEEHDFQLLVGNRAYCEASMGVWLYLRQGLVEFEDVRVSLYSSSTSFAIRRLSPSGVVPCLLRDTEAMAWGPISIIEASLSEFSTAVPWPSKASRRNAARSMAEHIVHGFQHLRAELPHNLKQIFDNITISPEAAAEWDHVCHIIRSNVSEDAGPWLFGDFTAVDAVFIPLVLRARTYCLPMGRAESAYLDAALSLSYVLTYMSDALDEEEVVQERDVAWRLQQKAAAAAAEATAAEAASKGAPVPAVEATSTPAATTTPTPTATPQYEGSIAVRPGTIAVGRPSPSSDTRRATDTQGDAAEASASHATGSPHSRVTARPADRPGSSPSRSMLRVVSLYDYVSQHPDELSFTRGELIDVLGKAPGESKGWWLGRTMDGVKGVFPSTYCRLAKEQEKAMLSPHTVADFSQDVSSPSPPKQVRERTS